MSDDQSFANLAALYAKEGHALTRTHGEGKAPYQATRWGHSRPLQNLDEARRFLQQLSGKKNQ